MRGAVRTKELRTDGQERGKSGAGRKKLAAAVLHVHGDCVFPQLDLRSIGEQALSDDVARNTKHEVAERHIA